MEILGLPWEIMFCYALLAATFVMFVFERIPADITAMGAMCILLAVGILDTKDALSVFSNEAPITILAMFIVSAALQSTGCIEVMGRLISKIGGRNEFTLIFAVMIVAMAVSPFMNNTPVVVILTPVVITIARRMELAPSKVLIPLSFSTVLAGICTLLGTSTNLLVNGITINSGLEGFGIFDITMPGLMMAGAGFIYMMLIGRFLLPNRQSIASLLGNETGKTYIAQMLVPAGSKLVGQQVSASILNKGDDTEIIDVIRHGDSMREFLGDLILKAGDRVVIETNAREILGISESNAVEFESAPGDDLSTLSTSQNVVIEGIIANGSNLQGKLIGGLGFRRKYGVYVMGVHKSDHKHFPNTSNASILEVGDTILLEGPLEGMKQLLEENGIVNLSFAEDRPIRRHKAPFAIAALIGIVALSSFGVMPIVSLALIGAIFVVITGCVDARDIYKTVDWPILFLIFGMLGVSLGLEKTGAMQIVVDQIVGFSEAYGPLALLAGFYLLTTVLTEILSNNAIAALMAPIAIGVAQTMGISPYPLLVAVMFAASASFATPIGYQTNTFVYGAGGYKFRDFLIVGLPLNCIMFAVAMVAIPMFWEF